MKKYYVFFIVMLISFYFTNELALLAKNSNPIMKNINEIKDSLYVSSIDAIIVDDYIIPGLNGKEINVNASFNKMKPYKVFNDYYLIYKQVKPKISYLDHKDKIILKGNPNKKEVSIISNNKYFINKDIKYTKNEELKYKVKGIEITKSNYNSFKNNINNGSILLISNDLSTEEIDYLLNYTQSKGLKIVSIDELISEENNS